MKRLLQVFLVALTLSLCAPVLAIQGDPQVFYDTAQERLTTDAYSEELTYRQWQRIKPDSNTEIDWSRYDALFDALAALSKSIGVFGKVVLVLLLLVFFVWLYRHKDAVIHTLTKPKTPKSAKITPNFLPDSQMDNLPAHEQIAQLTSQLIADADYVGALSLLYRASLRAMSIRHQMVIGLGRTEEECSWLLHFAKTAKPDEKQFFERLVGLWQKSAYGSKSAQSNIGRDDVTALLSAWQTVWDSL